MSQEKNKNYVYHGSPYKFDIATPSQHKRGKVGRDGKPVIYFDEISFHATPHKWIALAYTYKPKPYTINGKTYHYNMGVDLINYDESVIIYGFDSPEKSLTELYGDGGYLATFDSKDFFHKEGLGEVEVITKDKIKPLSIEGVRNVPEYLKSVGIKIRFIDLLKKENEDILKESHPSVL